jgi:hypothetical protein
VTPKKDEREQASAALVAAIVRLATAIGAAQTASVLGSVAADLKTELTQRGADALASEKARQSGGLH